MSHHAKRTASTLIAAFAAGIVCIWSFGAGAAEQAGAEISPIQKVVQQGADIFAREQFGGAGTCETCHANGGRTAGQLPNGMAIPSLVGAAAGFPRFSQRQQSVTTLAQQIRRCVAGGLQGSPPAFGSPQMVDLETYITSLSKGAVMGTQFN
jgi:thiosulfate dehydrogenase